MEEQQNNIVIQSTEDGSSTLFNSALNETYHSVKGALSESQFVYIDRGLKPVLSQKKAIHILEVGLGTALNALLTLNTIPSDTTIFYTALEPYPISIELANAYYASFLNDVPKLELLPKLIAPTDERIIDINNQFHFCNLQNTIQTISFSKIETIYKNSGYIFQGFDLVYFDAFAPSKQPEMWTHEVFEIVSELMASNGLLTTYCAQGQFKRNLIALGFQLNVMPGHGGKKEMVTAIKTRL
ncbi:MAG: tRNA (5-methylaminomethyl-2-thiouridine)(34)-methyltransferase MnmD [Bacteroidota bacterium]